MKEMKLLTTAQAARAADVTVAAVHIWVKSGLLPAYTVALGTRGRVLWLVHPDDLAAMPRTQAARKRRRAQAPAAPTLPDSVRVAHSTD